MFFHSILLYTGLWQGIGVGKRCQALAKAQIYITVCAYVNMSYNTGADPEILLGGSEIELFTGF